MVRSHRELDLTDRAATFDFIMESRPQVIIDAAAKVGGILANSTYPADFLSENLQIQVNLLDAAVAARVPRLLFLGSSCIYPKFAEQPIKESALLTARWSRRTTPTRSPRSPVLSGPGGPAANTAWPGSLRWQPTCMDPVTTSRRRRRTCCRRSSAGMRRPEPAACRR
ncbi:GDP-L-fucose synthase 1 [Mycobacterium kansasii 662]|uniref:GDP-L-fucose synthase 1 n=1 Tax=Mycobacterium kansasii 662 TaxID=1299326 RepID=X7XPP3_MYCKA|nr:GDP-L-fucose synthase 1 [Mycobacterium kansasii 662]